jgi:hypothetical protein
MPRLKGGHVGHVGQWQVNHSKATGTTAELQYTIVCVLPITLLPGGSGGPRRSLQSCDKCLVLVEYLTLFSGFR